MDKIRILNLQIPAKHGVFDFEKDIYNKKIKVFLVKKIRDEKRFLSKEGLKKQLLKDQNISAKYLMP